MSNNKLFENNKQLISEYAGFHPDDIAALDNAVHEMIEAGVGKLKEISVEDNDTYNWVLMLTNDENQEYYLELSEHGNIVMLRKDGSEGEVILSIHCGIEEFADSE